MYKLKRKKKINLKKIILFILILFFIIGGLVCYGFYRTLAQSAQHMYKPLHKDEKLQQNETDIKNPKPISILLLGVDERHNDVGRSDSMIVININPETKRSTMVSIPRDTRVFNPEKNSYSKMNAAYAYGGVEGSVRAVEEFLNISIDYYIKVNMDGFKDIVNAVGGVTINNPFAFILEGVYIPEGRQHIDGKVALKYVRMRKEDPLGDFGRQKRQREVIDQIIHEGTKIKSLSNYPKILKILEKNVQTNLTLDQIIDIQRAYKPAVEKVKQVEIEGEGKIIDGIWYYVVSDGTRGELSKLLLGK
ncbi:LCP family protein [Heyndrickxia sp. FSL K6-6286]|uniref:LCP family glycopolymer transferase n=1 Tax=Heyndrickxia TaxID=2837504 RepID=UPI001C0F3673|nr:LCP family protein [Heyndrickxia oleronia]MBU5210845.1 LCP family protein [Heyndrickxia oleronia]